MMYRYKCLNTHTLHFSPRKQICVYARQTKSPVRTKQDTTYTPLSNNIIGFGISVCSSIVALSICSVVVLTLRETSFEAEKLHEEYDILHEEVELLKDRDVQHEIVINALVNELLELRNIGIL